MLYTSTRGGNNGTSSAYTIKKGIASDGGLFVPEDEMKISTEEMKELGKLDYKSRAIKIISLFLTDFTEDEISDCVESAYTADKFESENIVPLIKLKDGLYVMELWHGPTSAFKDIALQILPMLMLRSLSKTGENKEIIILTATSGDTGKAALEGFKNIAGTRVIVFYPENGVSEIQRLQMVTQEGENLSCVAVKGNFDDAQNGVKAIFADTEFGDEIEKAGFKFSSANSINWGRLVPQIVYYFSSYLDLLYNEEIELGEKVNFLVPTGNFGNILAGYYAYKIGLPVNKFICASNDNKVLTDFINTGIYNSNRDFKRTISPSMDILVSSNLERLLFDLSDGNDVLVKGWMEALKSEGVYKVDKNTFDKINSLFFGGYSNEEEVLKTIKATYKEYNYVVDPHTGVGVDVYNKYLKQTKDNTKTILASTASPFKFNESVTRAIFGNEAVAGKTEIELLDVLSQKCKLGIPRGLMDLDKKQIIHKTVCEKDAMKDCIRKLVYKK